MRSGTSMMMKALSEGGLDPVMNLKRNELNIKFGDEHFTPNKGGFYELERNQMQQFDFPRPYEGKLIKVLYGGLRFLAPGDYKIVLMLRNPEEIRQSYHAFFSSDVTFNQYDNNIQQTKELIQVRTDFHATELNYRDVVDNPKEAFNLLASNGWPIDVDRATAVVDPELCRFKLEELEIGI